MVQARTLLGGNMQIGDLVKWEDSKGNPEYGIVLELKEPTAFDNLDRVFVWFSEDDCAFLSVDDLEVICK